MTEVSGAHLVAIVGVACRFPGSRDPAELWDALLARRDLIGPVPAERLEIAPWAREGGFLAKIDRFDASFFGLSRREAERMDPQQRIALEVAWEAFEDAGLALDRIDAARAGVFAALSHDDHAHASGSPVDRHRYSCTGTALHAAAGRLSNLLGLAGPSIAVDAAHASSLVAVHLARQSLLLGDCDVALVCAGNLVLSPAPSTAQSQGATPPDERCRAFDAAASGIVRSDGVGALVLRPLAAALAAGDRIHAVIRSTAINHGGAGPRFTHAEARQAVLHAAYQRAGIDPLHVQYIEADGTGNAADDAAELHAIDAVLCRGRGPDRPLHVGSIKTNLGHTATAAGMAGLIKTVLALQHRTIPANLHFTTPSPRIAWDRIPVVVPTEAVRWPDTGGSPARAGVSSAGSTGTNAHVVLEELMASRGDDGRAAAIDGRPYLFVASARSDEALDELVTDYRGVLARPGHDLQLRDLCHAAGTRRSHGSARLAVVARSIDDLAAQLEGLAAGEPSTTAVRGRTAARPGKLAFAFAGMGSQWLGMARVLIANEPVFRAALELCDDALRVPLGWSVIEHLFATPEVSRLDDIDIAQPAIFSVQVALVTLLGSWGIVPDGVIGHSQGELAAAHVAGALSLHDAARIVSARSHGLTHPSVRGAMAIIGLPVRAVEELIAPWRSRVWVSIHESPESTAISGEPAAVDAAVAASLAREVFARRIRMPVAGHCEMFDSVRESMVDPISDIRPHPAHIHLQSTVDLDLDAHAGGAVMGPLHWWNNVRRPVLFAEAMHKMISDGFDTFLEISPHSVLCHAMLQCAKHAGVSIMALPTTRRNADERTVLLSALGALYTRGREIDWTAVCDGKAGFVPLPHNPWQRERYWFMPSTATDAAASVARGDHPMLERHIELHDTGHHVWESSLDIRTLPMLADHRVAGAAVLSGTSYVEIVLAAARTACEELWPVLHDIVFEHAQVLPDDAGQVVQVSTSDTTDGAVVRLHARYGAGDAVSWSRLAVARATHGGAVPAGSRMVPESVAAIRARCDEPVTPAAHYEQMAAGAVVYGPTFQGVRQLVRRDGEALGLIGWPVALAGDRERFLLHPALLDACWQVVVAAVPRALDATRIYVPLGIRRLRVIADGPVAFDAGPFQCHARVALDGSPGEALSATLVVLRSDDSVLVEIDELRLQPLEGARSEVEAAAADAHHVGNGASGDPRGSNGHWRLAADLLAAADSERQPRIEALLTYHLAQVLGRPAAGIQIDAGLNHIGLDSLRALEFRNRIRADLDVAPSLARLVMSDVSLRALARDIVDQLATRPRARPHGPAASPAHGPGAELGTDELSEEQILALLQELDGGG
jgi:acyl transferase domain-containing protein